MSIATRIQAMSNHITADYIAIRRLGVDLEGIEKNIENIASVVDTAYANLPKVTGEGSNLSLTPTREGGLTIIPKGACEQDSYSGKNILGLPNITKTSFGVTATNVDDVITISGTGTNAPTLDFTLPQDIIMDGNYNVLVEFEGTKNLSTFQVLFRNSSGGNMFVNRLENTNKINTIQTISNTPLHYVRIYLNNGATIDGTIKIMLTKSSTLDDVFEKYVGGIPSPSPDFPQNIRVVTGENSVVVSNKNLFDKSKRIESKYPYANGEINQQSIGFDMTDYIPVKPNTNYIVSVADGTLLGRTTAYCFYDKNKNYIYGISHEGLTSPYIIATPSNCYYIIDSVNKENVNSYMIEEGSTVTSYVEGKQQTYTLHLGTNYLAGIGDYKDEIVGKTDDWKIKRYVGKINIKDLSWEISTSNPDDTSLIMFRTTSITDRLRSSDVSALCNYLTFKGTATSASSGRNKGIGFWFFYSTTNTAKTIFIILPKSIANNETELTQWATTNNVVLYYQLETPVEIPITDTTLITDLNNMYQAMGYDGTTNITITSDTSNAQMTASVSALKGE